MKMREYILSLLTVSAVAGAVGMVPPDGPLKKYVRYIISLAVALTLLLPLGDLVKTLPAMINISSGIDISENDAVLYENRLVAEAVFEIEKNTAEAVLAKTGVYVKITLEVDDTDPQLIIIKSVRIKADGSDRASGAGIALYVSDILGLPYSSCEMEYK